MQQTSAITLDPHLEEGTRRVDPGNDPWPMRHRLILRPDGRLDWQGDEPGGGWREVRAITDLGPIPGNLTGAGLLDLASCVRASCEAQLVTLLGGDRDDTSLQARGAALEVVREQLDDLVSVGGDFQSIMPAHEWMGDGETVDGYLAHPTPADWLASARSGTDHVIDRLEAWLVADIEDKLADADMWEQPPDALRAWWAAR